MSERVRELCRQLKPVLGRRVDGLWAAYLASAEASERNEIEQTLELLAAKHLKLNYQPDRSPFPPPSKSFAGSGDVPLGTVSYAGRPLYPFALPSPRLKEHVLVAGRSGSGKTNLTFVLMHGLLQRGINVLALDWKRSYRDLRELHPQLRVYTIGRDIAPFRFNPLIPPSGCEPHVWIKLVVDVIASAYLGGEGVISLLVAGLDHLFRKCGAFDPFPDRWPTVQELLAWLRSTKLKGRAAMWQASAERILLAMTYGEFGAVLNTQNAEHVQHLLDHNVVLEMDGLSNSSDRVLFSEALTLYLYRYRLAKGPVDRLTNVIVLEEAHNLLLAKPSGTRESVLETSIRMIRQYGIGYVFVDQSASLLSKVAFANSYATIALSQKLRADVQVIAGAMNLSDEQKEALNTLPVGTAVIRLADEHTEPFLIRLPRSSVREGSVTDEMIRRPLPTDPSHSSPEVSRMADSGPYAPIPPSDNKSIETIEKSDSHPPSPSHIRTDSSGSSVQETDPPPGENLSREAVRFLVDVAARPLSTTVARYQRLHLSRRRGDAIRRDLLSAGILEAVPIATRSGQVVLHQLTESGRARCEATEIDPGPRRQASLAHTYWLAKAADHFQRRGYDVFQEHAIDGNGIIDVVATRNDERIAIEVETGKSDIAENINKTRAAGFDRIILLATSPAAVTACQRMIQKTNVDDSADAELWTWLDIS